MSILVSRYEDNETVFYTRLGNVLMMTEHGGHCKKSHIHHRQTDEDEKE